MTTTKLSFTQMEEQMLRDMSRDIAKLYSHGFKEDAFKLVAEVYKLGLKAANSEKK